jgi:hypothetical protein
MRQMRGTPKIKKRPPYEFILDELSGLDLTTRRMFGCTAVYVGPKIMFVMYKPDAHKDEDEFIGASDTKSTVLDQDIGIWVCIPNEHTTAMKTEFPQLKGVSFFPDENSAWQCLPESHPDFEDLALKFCKMIQKGDPRIGRLPKPKSKSKPKKKLSNKKVAQKPSKNKKPAGKAPPALKKTR